MRITVHNRGPETATLHVLPQLWFRNTWSWRENATRPALLALDAPRRSASQSKLFGDYRLYCDGAPTLLFCDNETNAPAALSALDAPGSLQGRLPRVRRAGPARTRSTRAGRHQGRRALPARAAGPRASADDPPAARQRRAQARPSPTSTRCSKRRRAEADEFYAALQAGLADPDARSVQRQAFAGMIWSKQFFHYDVPQWLNGDPGPAAAAARAARTAATATGGT